ncbi:CNNM domain-containing protein [Herbidospora mongoliensis]|uniref:CNNM domain-containing protein n=1 Tax=Herbidospora mongoliensis TaxID=688067 RepID=UPI000A03A9F2|nr:hemolysin family protein [Herbidospora mongoliensis]
MSSTMALLLGVVLLALNGFFVAAEFAVISARRHRLEEAATSPFARIAARAALRGSRQLSLMLAGAQLGITLCSLGLGMVTEPALHHLLEPLLAGLPESVGTAISYVLALAIVTFLHMVVGEMAPKSLALTHPESAALALALPFRGFVWLVRPLLAGLNGLTNGMLRLFGVRPRDELATARTPHQLAVLVAESGRMGMLDRDEHDLLTRALRVQNQPVERLMTPIADAVTIAADAPAEHVHKTAVAANRLRMLVTSPEGVRGVLHVRDSLVHPEMTPGELATPVPTLKVSTPIPDAVTALQDARAQLGLVVDERGEVVGEISVTSLIGELLTV